MGQVVTISFFRFDSLASKAWALTMMGVARFALPRVPQIGFWKLFGSGSGEGFNLAPNPGVYAVLATWPDMHAAKAGQHTARIFARYRARACEHWTLYLGAQSARGAWSGRTPFTVSDTAGIGPLAVITRATIKPRIAAKFWGRVPNISAVIGDNADVLFKIGVGEVPFLHQVTFSIWPDATRMAGFARTGPHADAIKCVRSEGWFSEELYARFACLSEDGTWGGTSPLAGYAT